MTTAQPANTLPRWIRDADTRRAAVVAARRRFRGWVLELPTGAPRWAALYLWHVVVGLGRLTRQLTQWIADQDSADLQRGHAWNEESAEYVKVHAVRRSHLHARLLIAGAAVVLVGGPIALLFAPYVLSGALGVMLAASMVKAIPGRGIGEIALSTAVGAAAYWFGGMWLASLTAPRWLWWALYGVGAVAVVLLERKGRPQSKPADAAVRLANGAPSVRLDVVRDALCTLGIAGMKDPESIGALQMPHRHGAGVQVEVQLPAGLEAVAVLSKAGRLASALRREEKCVHLAKGRRNAGHLIVYVADQPMTEQDQGKWALNGTKVRSIFEPFPVGTNVRGEWVSLTLAYANAVIGAVPRVGKTFFLRELGLGGAHDLRVKVCTFDGKGTGDFRPLDPIAHFRTLGDDPEEIERVLAFLRGLRKEMRRRAAVLATLSAEECPENKIDDRLAGRDGFEPYLLLVDETQAYFCYGSKTSKEDKAIRAEFEEIITDLIKRGPAMGFIVLLATQSVNSATIPRGISTNAVIRFAMRLFDHIANDLVLGTGAFSKGLATTDFDADDRGIGILRGDGSDPQTIRTVFGLDAPTVRAIATRLAKLRAAAGRLTGQAAGEDIEPEIVVDFLHDVRGIVLEQERRNVSLQWLRDELADLRPDTWGALTVDALGAQLREAGVTVDAVWCPAEGKTAKGVKPEWVRAADAIDEEVDDQAEDDPAA